jgi:flagellar FliL protein
MSDEEASGEEALPAAEPAKANIPVVPLLIAVVLAVVLATGGAGGFLFWAIKSGKLPMGGTVKTVQVVVEKEPMKTKMVPLDPLLVNLADPDGRSYLRISLTLKVEDPPPPKDAKEKPEAPEKGKPKNEFEAEERDVALGILGGETGVQLLEPDGKENLKKKLVSAFRDQVPDAKVVDVLITEFLVQR